MSSTNPSGWLLRHAQSLTNTGIPGDPHQTPLSPVGQQQAQWFAKRFNATFPAVSALPLSIVVTSNLPRTHQTIAPLLALQPQLKHEIWPIHEFTNLPHAIASGQDQAAKNAAIKAYWAQCDPYLAEDDGSTESFVNFITRVENCIDRLKTIEHQRMILCGHGLFLTALRWRLLVFPLLSSEKQRNPVAFMQDFGQYLPNNLWKNSAFRPFSVNSKQMIRIKKACKPPSFSHNIVLETAEQDNDIKSYD